MNTLLLWWKKISDNGLHDGLDSMEVLRISLFNKCLFVGLIAASHLVVLHLFRAGLMMDLLASCLLVILLASFFLQTVRKYHLARLVTSFILPVMAGVILVASLGEISAEYIFFLNLIMSVILFKRQAIPISIAIYSIIIFAVSTYLISVKGADLGIKVDILQKCIVFSASALCLFVISAMFVAEHFNYLRKNQELVTQLQLQNKDLERFTHIASHDLKTPLRNIVSFLDLINRRSKDQRIREVQPYFDRVNRSARQMHALVDDIMSFTLHKRENYVLEAVDLYSPVEMAINQLQSQIEERNVQVKLPDNFPSVTGQRNQLAVVFQNLFENAIKYNESSPPVITITTQETDSEVIIQIQDNGVGFAPGFEEKIFEMFERLHPSEHYEGTGLGLAICRRILQLMDATIEATSNDTGALFTIKMKLAH